MSKILTIVAGILAALLVVQTVRLHRLEQRYLNGVHNLNFEEITPTQPDHPVVALSADAAPSGTFQGSSSTSLAITLGSTEEASSPNGTSAQRSERAALARAIEAAPAGTKERLTDHRNSGNSGASRRASQSSARKRGDDLLANFRSRKTGTGTSRRDTSLARTWVSEAKDASLSPGAVL